MRTDLRIIFCFVGLWPAVCFSEPLSGYSAYTSWTDWARLRVGINTGLASSYDRQGGNDDYSHYEEPNGLRTGNEIVTAATLSGPGIIYRFWMPHLTAKRNFIVRMYFDGEEAPRIDTDSLDLLGGAFGYFSSPLVTTCAGGQVCYEPIPFRTSVRIETENKANNRHYYQYSYLKYPPEAVLESYTETLTPEQQIDRASVVSLFENAGEHPAGSSPAAIDIVIPATVIEPNSGIDLADLTGPGIIRRLNVGMADANEAELDGLRLRVYYDDSTEAAIDVPVGDFFGAGRSRALYKSIPLGTDSNDGFYCYWPMPFRRSVAVRLHNTTDSNIPIDSAAVQYEPAANLHGMCYLHAVENSSAKQPGQIYHSILSTTGCGHYVGGLLYIEQDNYSFYMLEGDDVITVDGNDILYGTGLEDAYNGGYYYNWVGVQADEPEGMYPQSAIRPLHGILYVHRQEGVQYSRADQYRWRIADCVPFSRSIEVNIENRYAPDGSEWTSVAFWYQYPCRKADFDGDCDVDFHDFADFTSSWLNSDCADPDWCGGADFDQNRRVDMNDLADFLDCWL
ncbi:MAG: DUF2961 domain-containing protein [Sedimentisphaerales bacterium]|nr:DUF2961 domain-containing protein [Sedimentisphaerales bacterium]